MGIQLVIINGDSRIYILFVSILHTHFLLGSDCLCHLFPRLVGRWVWDFEIQVHMLCVFGDKWDTLFPYPFPSILSFSFDCYWVIWSFHPSLTVIGEQGTQVGAELMDKKWLGWALVHMLWQCQRFRENPESPGWQSLWLLEQRQASPEQHQIGEDVRHVVDNVGNMDHVRRTGIGRGLSPANLRSGDSKSGLSSILGILQCSRWQPQGELWPGHCCREVLCWKRSAMCDREGETSRPELAEVWSMDCLHLSPLRLPSVSLVRSLRVSVCGKLPRWAPCKPIKI